MRPRSIDYVANIDTSIRLHARCLVFIRADLRSVDTDRSGKAIGQYDTLVINSRPSSTTRTYIPIRRIRARINREEERGKRRKHYKLVVAVV